ncbi:unnamed protein product [Didymodactylos carnosus]|uniref:EXPERA domain-containing protein n=1 Tax=Didymodactylos carnosus TaxID=1234261 RepID=A0A814GJV7_9BILA|nr:unnamed protein product [Didymodactylos carnosus]CAF1190049.1 unnamed protein product [Didymodactylos carnosus]CAF3768914.1 unnamed protein product [Didymodactylos carnosus]CAF4001063.1 unnamed protein product [Didymodactylos carnosus]
MQASNRKNIKTLSSASTASDTATTDDHGTKGKIQVQAREPESSTRILLGVVTVSLLAIPICYILSHVTQMENSFYVFLCGVVICTSVAPLTYHLLIKRILHVKRETYFYVFTIFSFTAMVDLLLALTIDNYSSACHFYLEQGEVYLKTSHGLFINYWDGTVHYTLYLIMLYCILKKQTNKKFYRFLSLFWCGSILNSMIVLLGGAAAGQFGTHIKPSYLLNIPYAMFPLIFVIRRFRARTDFINQRQQKRGNKTYTIPKSLISRPLDIFFIAYLLFAIIFAIYRVLHVLRSPMMTQSVYYEYEPYMLNASGFPLIQLITYAFYFVPYYCSTINALLFYNQQSSKFQWLPDWTMVHAGAAAQAQFSYLFSSLHSPTLFPDSSWSAVPSQYRFIIVGLNSILAIVPQLLAFRICGGVKDQEFY